MSLILSKLKKEAIIYCPLCNKEYKPENIKIVDQADETILAHSNCPRCQGAILSLLYKDALGITLIGMVTDLNYDDAIRVKDKKMINQDDILEIYQVINK